MAKPIEDAVQRWAVPDELLETVHEARLSGSGAHFAQSLLEQLQIRFAVGAADRERIPRAGAAIIVANHPYGIVEGLILTVVLDAIRPDYKLVVNSLLAKIDALSEHIILINPFGGTGANVENRAPLRRCLRWIAGGGLAAIFPAGEVAHLTWGDHVVREPRWNTTAARLAIRAHAPVIPVFFEGANSPGFQLAGTIHPGLRTIGLLREFMKLRGKSLKVRIGNPISYDMVSRRGTADSATDYLRSRTLFLANRPWPSDRGHCQTRRAVPVDPSGYGRVLADEIASLPPSAELARSEELSVYVARAAEIPHLLPEIGRAREETFRRVGEGTGKATDLDWFDQHYLHLFLWSRQDRRLAGAYRMALTHDVLPRFGTRGLYTSTLFRYQPAFFDRIGPALELGRSFVCADFQKSYAPLLLLWKGITRFVRLHPEAAMLFGAASISRQYQAASRGLMACYLSELLFSDLTLLVRPRRRWREPATDEDIVQSLAGGAKSIDDISLLISDIEDDGKGVPALIGLYLKVGGKVISFNVDRRFSNSVDVLLVADLRSAPVPMLERCMGRAEARSFLEWHAQKPGSAFLSQ